MRRAAPRPSASSAAVRHRSSARNDARLSGSYTSSTSGARESSAAAPPEAAAASAAASASAPPSLPSAAALVAVRVAAAACSRTARGSVRIVSCARERAAADDGTSHARTRGPPCMLIHVRRGAVGSASRSGVSMRSSVVEPSASTGGSSSSWCFSARTIAALPPPGALPTTKRSWTPRACRPIVAARNPPMAARPCCSAFGPRGSKTGLSSSPFAWWSESLRFSRPAAASRSPSAAARAAAVPFWSSSVWTMLPARSRRPRRRADVLVRRARRVPHRVRVVVQVGRRQRRRPRPRRRRSGERRRRPPRRLRATAGRLGAGGRRPVGDEEMFFIVETGRAQFWACEAQFSCCTRGASTSCFSGARAEREDRDLVAAVAVATGAARVVAIHHAAPHD